MPEPVLRAMRVEDVEAVMTVQEPSSIAGLSDVFPQDTHPFPRDVLADRWRAEVADPGIDCFVILRDGEVAGFAAVSGAEVKHFGVALDEWGSGLARAAHDELLARMKMAGIERPWLSVYAANPRGRAFWEKLGWRDTGERSRGPMPPHAELMTYAYTPHYVTRLLTPETWDDFAELVESNNGVWGGCWCIGFHPEGLSGSGQDHREAKERHTREGTVHQVLVYDGDRCVGWCQFGTPDELPNIKNATAYEKELDELPRWRIGCVFTGSKHRGRGVARAAVTAVLEEIRRAGGGTVEAYPEQVDDRKPQRGAYLHTGPETLYADLGFVRDRQIAKWRWVMRREVDGG